MKTINGIKKLKKEGYSVAKFKNKYTAAIVDSDNFIQFFTHKGRIITVVLKKDRADISLFSKYHFPLICRDISQALRLANN